MRLKHLFFMFLAVVTGLLIPSYLSARVTHYGADIRFKRFGLEQGLMARKVFSITQDKLGFMWFATNQGIVKHDGCSFVHFKHNPHDENSPCSNDLNCIAQDSQERLWVGTHNGLDIFDPGSGTFLHYRSDPNDPGSLSDNVVWSILHGSKASWIGTGNGLNKFAAESHTFTQYTPLTPLTPQTQGNPYQVFDIYEDNNGILWLASNVGAHRFDPSTGIFSPVSPEIVGIWCIHKDRQGFTWFGGRYGLYRYEPVSGALKIFRHDPGQPGSIGSHAVHDILEITPKNGVGNHPGNNGKTELWFATDQGISSYDPETGMFIRITHNPLKLDSLGSNLVLSLFQDRSGVIWIGTFDRGLNKLEPGGAIFAHYYHEPYNPNSLSCSLVSSLYEDAAGILWIGTYEGGFNRFDPKSKTFRSYFSDRSKTNDRFRAVTALDGDGQGKLWIGTFGGVFLFDPVSERFRHYAHDPQNPLSVGANVIYSIYCDKKQYTWFGTDGSGVSRFDPGSGTFTHYTHDPANPQSLSSNTIFNLCADRDGRIWVGTDKGLDRLDPLDGRCIHYFTPAQAGCEYCSVVNAVYPDPLGNVWIGTDCGLLRLDPVSKDFKVFTTADGLPSGKISAILQDNSGYLWLSSDQGLGQFDPRKGGKQTRVFDYRDGLQHNEFAPGAKYKSSRGLLYFGGINGFNIFNPADIEDNLQAPPVVITAFKKLDREVKFDKPVWEVASVELSYQAETFSFEFAALDYHAPEKNRYAYMMEGFDRDWKYRDYRERRAYYTQLPQGTYTFRVKACNNSGIWNETGASIKVTILPAFWRSWWFTLLGLALFALVSYLLITFTRKYITLISFWKKKNFIGHYRIIEEIGSGGMGTVYKAEHIMDNNRTAAVKVIREDLIKDTVHRKRFLMEAAIIDQLDHPHIVKIIERGEYNERLFIAMEYLEGESLAKRIDRLRQIPVADAVDIMVQLLDVIAKLHMKDIVHRDLKPENIMLLERGGDKNYVKLLDFGLAKTTSLSHLTESGMLLGTISYLSPEIASGEKFTPAADVYALGVIFYEMVTGEKPFIGDSTLDIMKQILNELPIQPRRLRPEIPGKINRLIMYMLTKVPRARPEAGQVCEALLQLKDKL